MKTTIPEYLSRADMACLGDDAVKIALAWAVFDKFSVPGLQPFGNDNLLTEHECHELDQNAFVLYDTLYRHWIVVCQSCGFVAITSPGSTSIDGGIGDDDWAEMQETCEPAEPLVVEAAVSLALARIDNALRTMPHVIFTDAERTVVHDALQIGWDV